jgi:hypothetical protein
MAWRFDGVNDHAYLADAPALTLGSNWTVGGWFQILSNAGTTGQYLVNWGAVTAYPSFDALVYKASSVTTPNKLRGRFFDSEEFGNSPATLLSSTSVGVSAAWQHVLWHRNGGEFTQYINGVANGSSSPGEIGEINCSASMFFGTRSDFAATLRFFGQMAEWAKWDRALSAAEIAVLAAGATPDWFANGLAWYLPMRKEPVELVRGIPVKLIGATPVDHPLHFRPAPMGWAARAQGVGE